MAIATAQFTIVDFNDVNISTNEPSNPVKDQLWLDTNVVPNQLKRWNGTAWIIVNDVKDIQNQINDTNFVFINPVNITAAGSTLTKTGGTDGTWDAGISNTFKFNNGDCIEFNVGSISKFMIGLSTKDTDVNYTTIDYAIYPHTDGTLYIYEKGSNISSSNKWTSNDVLAIGINNSKVIYMQNGLIIYTSTVIPTLPLVFDSSFCLLNSSLNNIRVTKIQQSIINRIQSAEQKITPGAIISTVRESTEYVGDLGAATSSGDTALTKANEVEEQLNGKANQADLNTLNKTVTEHYTELTQTTSGLSLTIGTVTTNTKDNKSQIDKINTYFQFNDTGLNIGKSNSPLNINISNSEIDFIDNGKITAYINGQTMKIDKLEVLTSLLVGVHKLEKYNDNITILKYAGQ